MFRTFHGLQWPKAMSNESYTDFVDWLELIKRKAKRAIVEDTDDKEDCSNLAE